jgi:hypothetical protein
MDRYVSQPLTIATDDGDEEFSRADLVFYGVDHSGPSYEGRVFINNADATVETPVDPGQGYAGSFMVFGHGGCYGDEGHCDTTRRTEDAFDVRLPHPLTPYTKTVIVTDALRRAGTTDVVVTVVPVTPGEDGPEAADVLHFDRLRLLTYD